MSSKLYTSRDLLTDAIRHEKVLSSAQSAGKVMHHSNNVFQAITLHLQYALEEIAPQSSAHEDVENTLRIVHEASTLYKKTQNSMQNLMLNPQLIDFRTHFESWISEVKDSLPTSIYLTTKICEGNQQINIDDCVLLEVLNSFVENAQEQMPNGGELLLETSIVLHAQGKKLPTDVEPGNYICISIQDSGPGFDPERMGLLFEPFNTRKNFQKGHGLSLTKAFFFAKKSGGFINVFSNAKNGTCFELFLPIVQDGTEFQATNKHENLIDKPVGILNFQGKSILIAEDNPIVMDVCRRMLQQEGLLVTSAVNGEEALELFFQHSGKFDLVILDIIMPRAMGTEVAESILKHQPKMPILFTSGYYKSIEETKVFHPAIKGILQKPFSREQFINAIYNALKVS